ncbi:hypothetical protein ACFSQJ_07235 [Croceitalea marina]|uniref:HMA domain-containing protein n=1 Tax=Croceitalea marina TaxID=1775166 RepID=A0ABW5MYH3_9FLAO
MKTQLARVHVQNSFCLRCKALIEAKLSEIQNISNIRLYNNEPMVVFNFFKANELSDVLNTLSEIGYPEIGERIDSSCFKKPKNCLC